MSRFEPRRWSLHLMAAGLLLLGTPTIGWSQVPDGTGASRTSVDAPTTSPAATPSAAATGPAETPAPTVAPTPIRGGATVEGGELAPPPATPNPMPVSPQRSALILKDADQINLLNALSGTEMSQWPALLKKNRHCLNKDFIEIIGLRSADALNEAMLRMKRQDKREIVLALVETSFRYALVADMAAMQLGQPRTYRMALAHRYADQGLAMRSGNGDLIGTALTISRNVIVTDKDHLDAHKLAADLELRTGDFYSALVDYQFVVKVEPGNDRAWASIGLIQLSMSNFQKAREALKRSLDINPSNEVAKGLLYRLEHPNQIAPASAQGDPTLTAPTVTGTAESLVAQGRQLLSVGKLDDAQKAFEQAALVDPKSAAAQMGLGDLFFRQSEFFKAIDAYANATQFDPNDPEPLYYMALACEQVFDKTGSQQHLDRAIECLHRAIQIKPDYPAARAAQERCLNAKITSGGK